MQRRGFALCLSELLIEARDAQEDLGMPLPKVDQRGLHRLQASLHRLCLKYHRLRLLELPEEPRLGLRQARELQTTLQLCDSSTGRLRR